MFTVDTDLVMVDIWLCVLLISLLMNRNMFVTLSADETGWNSLFTQLDVILDLDQTQLNTVLCDSYHKNLVLSAITFRQVCSYPHIS